MKQVLIFNSPSCVGSPSYERVKSFKEFYAKQGVNVIEERWPSNILQLFGSVYKIKKSKIKNVFISMPPFRSWIILFLPNVNVILDIRDGWSIAMSSGYGGLVKRSPVKSFIARYVERAAVRRARLTITCTVGLKDYLEYVSNKEVVLIENGVSDEDFELAKSLISKRITNEIELCKRSITFCCAGKFSEYGSDNVKRFIGWIIRNHPKSKFDIIVVGACKIKNDWVHEYLKNISEGCGSLRIVDRMNKSELYEILSASDYGVSIVRDADYEYGTKIFDYQSFGLKVPNYFEENNAFTDRFLSDLNSIEDPRRSLKISCAIVDVLEYK